MVVPMVSGVTMVALAAGLMLLPSPYAVERPGPTVNTTGLQGDTPIIRAEDEQPMRTRADVDQRLTRGPSIKPIQHRRGIGGL